MAAIYAGGAITFPLFLVVNPGANWDADDCVTRWGSLREMHRNLSLVRSLGDLDKRDPDFYGDEAVANEEARRRIDMRDKALAVTTPPQTSPP